VFFLVRFTKKPLRFFRHGGGHDFCDRCPAGAYLAIDRLVFQHPLADRPALLLSSLLVVLGMQLFALGLLGELIIFTHARISRTTRSTRSSATRRLLPAIAPHRRLGQKLHARTSCEYNPATTGRRPAAQPGRWLLVVPVTLYALVVLPLRVHDVVGEPTSSGL